MYIYSGKCRFCRTGILTDKKTVFGKPLITGDIVIIYTYDPKTELIEQCADHLTVVVQNDYQTFSDGHHEEVKESFPFIMGIAGCIPVVIGSRHYLKHDDSEIYWCVEKVKSYSDVISGEHWKDFGFNYLED